MVLPSCRATLFFFTFIAMMSVTHFPAQGQVFRTERIILNDGGGGGTTNTLTIQTAADVSSNATLTIPEPDGPAGSFLITNPLGIAEQLINGPLVVDALRLRSAGTGFSSTLLSPPGMTADQIYRLPLSAPSADGQVLSSTTGGVLSWSTPSSLSYFTEGWDNTTHSGSADNSVRTVVRLSAHDAAATDVDIAFSPKGLGALTAQVADAGATGGNKRGTRAVDWQMGRTGSAQVASGNESVIGGGFDNTAYGSYATVAGGSSNRAGTGAAVGGGDQNNASGNYATIAGGLQNESFGTYTTVVGGNFNRVAASGSYSAILGGYGMELSGVRSLGFNGESPNRGGAREVVIDASHVVAFNNVDLWLTNTVNSPAELRFYEAQNSFGTFPATTTNYTALRAGAQTVDVTYTLPTGYPTTDGQILTATATGEMSWSNPATLTYFTESITVAAPNSTVPVVQLQAQSGATDVDIAIRPKGEGALTAEAADDANSGGEKRGALATDWQRYRGNPYEVASGYGSTIGGGYGNRASGGGSTVSGGSGNWATSDVAAIGGGSGNRAAGTYATVAGGGANQATADYATVAGGIGNQATAESAAVGGGNGNSVAGDGSAIPGGRGLTLSASADRSFGFLGGNTGSRNMTIAVPDIAVFGNTDLWLANNDNSASQLRFYEPYNLAGDFPGSSPNTANYTAFRATTQTSDITYVLPSSAPTANGQVLTATTGGVMSWADLPTGAHSFSNNSTTTPTLALSNSDAAGVGLHVSDGRVILSYGSGSNLVIPSDVSVWTVAENGGVGGVVAALPVSGANGQVLYVLYRDTANGQVGGNLAALGDRFTFVYADGAWQLFHKN